MNPTCSYLRSHRWMRSFTVSHYPLKEMSTSDDYLIRCFPRKLCLALLKDTARLNAKFLIKSVLRNVLQQNESHVILVAMEESLDQYMYCLRKMGLNLQPYLASGQLHVIQPQDLSGLGDPHLIQGEESGSALRQLHSLIASKIRVEIKASPNTWTTQKEVLGVVGDDKDVTTTERVGGEATSSGRGKAWTIMIDNISCLYSLGCKKSDWMGFLHAVTSLSATCSTINKVVGPHACTLWLVVHADIPEDESWIKYLEHKSQVVVDVAQLDARMADIDGTVTITHRHASTSSQMESDELVAGGRSHHYSSVQQEQHMEAAQMLYFRAAAETGVKWITHIGSKDLL
ncbi:hypothetical protein CEUSTIGMA_g5743.t1 [Chlamydomonas eustigma]|uniref:Elongator complex protein 5 n=1 Tax=Chlamydomonas eustigma TaxID=1157962 RepID=A0A250X5E9_9CHLO|nr:hypothetical protein CEUSTIGMA_g5743.t1 [Chlamydomonas eustigma]|eukprot:GAX78301.1 hypothetical protein CEUSTIGMA_g5743.t1 [Chlamydomonas eustigma]